MKLPWWLSILLGLATIFFPQYKWLSAVVQAAYEMWTRIPWFNKPKALVELKKAVKKSKKSGDPSHVEDFTSKWKHKCEGDHCDVTQT